jgi:hypothetical protein
MKTVLLTSPFKTNLFKTNSKMRKKNSNLPRRCNRKIMKLSEKEGDPEKANR